MVFFPAYFHPHAYKTLSLVLPHQTIGCLKNAKWLYSDELPSFWVWATLYGAP